jgi:hypothetical protein
MKADEEESKAGEPQADYSDRVIITTFEKLEEMDREYTRRMNHVERMEYLQKLNYNLYGSDLSEQEEELRKGKLIIRKQE